MVPKNSLLPERPDQQQLRRKAETAEARPRHENKNIICMAIRFKGGRRFMWEIICLYKSPTAAMFFRKKRGFTEQVMNN
jgi:hypothetical protein